MFLKLNLFLKKEEMTYKDRYLILEVSRLVVVQLSGGVFLAWLGLRISLIPNQRRLQGSQSPKTLSNHDRVRLKGLCCIYIEYLNCLRIY